MFSGGGTQEVTFNLDHRFITQFSAQGNGFGTWCINDLGRASLMEDEDVATFKRVGEYANVACGYAHTVLSKAIEPLSVDQVGACLQCGVTATVMYHPIGHEQRVYCSRACALAHWS